MELSVVAINFTFPVLLFILLGLFSSWLILYILIGPKEFILFLKNSYQYGILFKGLMDSYIYPTPFIPETGCGLANANCAGSFRATKGIITVVTFIIGAFVFFPL